MFRIAITSLVVGGSLIVSACNTVRGVGEDVQSVANCTEEMMERGEC